MVESVFLSPKSIAVIGASDKPGSVGATITSNIIMALQELFIQLVLQEKQFFLKKHTRLF